jgi:magnesium transporter
MAHILGRRQRRAGTSPGTIEYSGEPKLAKPRITIMRYDAGSVEELEVTSVEQCREQIERGLVTWINLDGLHDTQLVRDLGDLFGLHPLVLEDIVTTTQRPKFEDHEDHLFFVLRMLTFESDKNEIQSEQLSLILTSKCLITFQENIGDCFDPVRLRIRKGKGRMRTLGPDYLAYALTDTIVDNYFIALEQVGTRIEELEDLLVAKPEPHHLQDVHELKREMILLRKAVWPLREVIASLERSDSPLINDKINIFLRDLYDHTVQAIDAVESFRDMLSSLHDLYLSSVSTRMNEVMKVLTVIATVFIPLTFLAGVYGMNFDFLPELHWRYGYPAFWLACGAIAVGLLTYFRRKRWM